MSTHSNLIYLLVAEYFVVAACLVRAAAVRHPPPVRLELLLTASANYGGRVNLRLKVIFRDLLFELRVSN